MFDMDSQYINSVLQKLNRHLFLFYEIDRNFNASTSFSDAKLSIMPIYQREDRISVKFGNLFPFGQLLSALPADLSTSLSGVENFIKTKCGTLKWPWLPSASQPLYEKEIMLKMAKNVFVPLFGKVTFEPSYREHISEDSEGIEVGPIRLGSKYTFHGMPDMRVNGSSYILSTSDSLESLSSGYGSVGKEY